MKWFEEGKKAALATVIQKQGSALRGVGSKMGVSSDMEMIGSISGGCVEGAVVQEALQVMKTGQTTIVDYGISDDEAWSVGLACGGQVKILIQPVGVSNSNGFSSEMLKKIIELKASDKTFCLLTDISESTKADICDHSRKANWFFRRENLTGWIMTLLEEINNLERTETSGIIKNDLR